MERRAISGLVYSETQRPFSEEDRQHTVLCAGARSLTPEGYELRGMTDPRDDESSSTSQSSGVKVSTTLARIGTYLTTINVSDVNRY